MSCLRKLRENKRTNFVDSFVHIWGEDGEVGIGEKRIKIVMRRQQRVHEEFLNDHRRNRDEKPEEKTKS